MFNIKQVKQLSDSELLEIAKLDGERLNKTKIQNEIENYIKDLGFGVCRAFYYPLYGKDLTITFENGRPYGNIEPRKIDLAFIITLLEKFKPIEKMYKVKNGCTAFKVKLTEKDDNADITEVEPYTIKLHPNHFDYNKAELKWYSADVIEDMIVQISVYPDNPMDILRYSCDVIRDKETKKIIDRRSGCWSTLNLNSNEKITWGRGSDDVFREMEIYCYLGSESFELIDIIKNRLIETLNEEKQNASV